MAFRVAILAFLLSASALVLSCSSKEPVNTGAGQGATDGKPSSTGNEVQDSSKTAEGALRALFNAVVKGDKKGIGQVLLGHAACMTITGEEARCNEIRRRNALFLAQPWEKSLPPESRLSDFVLLPSVQIPTAKGLPPVTMQKAQIRYVSRLGTSTLKNLAVLKVKDDWFVVPGQVKLPAKPSKPSKAAE